MAGNGADDGADGEYQNDHVASLRVCDCLRVTIGTVAIGVPAAPKPLKTKGKNFRDGLTYGKKGGFTGRSGAET